MQIHTYLRAFAAVVLSGFVIIHIISLADHSGLTDFHSHDHSHGTSSHAHHTPEHEDHYSEQEPNQNQPPLLPDSSHLHIDGQHLMAGLEYPIISISAPYRPHTYQCGDFSPPQDGLPYQIDYPPQFV